MSVMQPCWGPVVTNAPDWKKLRTFIVAPNHTSYMDPLFIQAACPLHVRFMMTEDIYAVSWMQWFFELWQAIPVPEGEAVKASAVKDALKAIRGGQPLGIFPEGKISLDGCLNPFAPGVVALMIRARVPVLPAAIIGTHRVLPYHANFPRAARVEVRFGEPIAPPEGDLDKDGLRAFAERIMHAIHGLGAPVRPDPTR